MRTGITISIIILSAGLLQAQCPDRNFLWNRIIYLRDSSEVAAGQQLKELLLYAKGIDQCRYKNDSTHALLLKRIGWLYSLQKDFYTAIQYTNRSIALVHSQSRKNNPSINPRHLISSYFNVSILYDSLQLETKKSAAIDSCISVALRLHEEYDYALNALVIKISRLFENGDYYSCIENIKLGESIVLDNKKTISYGDYFETQSFPWKVNSFVFLRRFNEAEKLVVDKINQYKKHGNAALPGTLYGLYGLLNMNQGNTEKALNYFKKYFDYNVKLKYNDGCAEALNNIGFTYSTSLHQNKTAIKYYIKALHFADANESLNILGNIANLYVQDRKYDSAFFFFQKAFNQLWPGFTEADLLKYENAELPGNTTEYVTGMILDKAAAWLNKYKITGNKVALIQAIRIYRVTDQYFDKLRVSQSEIQSKLFWKKNNRRLYEQGIEACYASNNIETAFYFFEKSRSVLLNDQISEQRGMDDKDLAKQAQLKKNILEIERKLQNIPSSSKDYLLLQQQLFSNKQEQKILMKNLHPPYQDNQDSILLTLEMARKNILNNSKTLVEIFSGDSAVYILNITPDSQLLTKVNKPLYDSLTRSFNSFIVNPGRLNKHFAEFISIAYLLYKVLFQNEPPPGNSIIISPDGINYPFEALVTNSNNKKPDYFIKHYATSYTYSAKYLNNRFVPYTNSGSSVLGMAPVQYDYQDLAELAGSDLSLKKISNYFTNATNYVLKKATRNNFEQNFPRYNIIQLYTHAADSSKNNDPVIYFSDSAFFLSDLIAGRRLITQLVVLSACETAKGKFYEGEGIFSFNRGFAALGVPAAVSNLWSVDNESTYLITELFYKYLSQGLPTDIALQKAKLEFIHTSTSKEKTLPWFWAGPILTGKVDTIMGNNGFPWKTVATAGILLLCTGYFIKKIILTKKEKITLFIFT